MTWAHLESSRPYHDEIDRDDLPVMIWHSIGHQSSCQRVGQVFMWLHRLQPSHTPLHSSPCLATRSCMLPGLLSFMARVTHYWGVMEGGHYVVSELTIQGTRLYLDRVPGHPFPTIPYDISFCHVQLLTALTTVSSCQHSYGPFQNSVPSPSRVTWEGPSSSATMD